MSKYIHLDEDNSYLRRVPPGNVLWDANNFCTVEALVKDGKAAQFRVVEMVETPAPEYDPVMQSVARINPALVDGAWTEQWAVTSKYNTPAEIAAAELAHFTAQKNIKKAATDEQYETRMVSGITYQGLAVQSSDRAVINIIGANRNPNASRKNVIGGQPIQITAQTIAALETATVNYTDALGEKRYDLYVAINAAANNAALALIDTDAGWPSNAY